MTGERERAYARATHARMARWGQLWMLVCVGALLAWWPLDWVLYDAATGAIMGQLRAQLVALHVVVFAALRWFSPARARPDVVLPLYHAAALALGAASMAALGGPGTVWFGYLYFGVLPAALQPLRLRWRVFATLGPVVAALLAYFARAPRYLADPATPSVLSFLVFMVIIAVVMGAALEHFQRKLFFHYRVLTRTTGALQSLNDELAQRLDERTRAASTVRTEERKRIARELHDELGQELTAARLALSLTKARHAHARGDIGVNLQELDRILARTTATMRDLIAHLRPRVLEDLGLAGALERLVAEVQAAARLRVRLAVGAQDVPMDAAAAIYRFVQEALTNVVRHAATDAAWATISAEPGAWVAEVRDLGQGLGGAATGGARPDADADGDTGGVGNGLVGMRERAAALGGTVTWSEAEPGRGTRVVMRLPRGQA